MRHLWLDVTAGVSGDMLLGALVDAGAPLEGIREAVQTLVGDAVSLSARAVTRAGQRATKLDVSRAVDDVPHRAWRDIREMLAAAELDPWTRTTATAAFQRLADAEARAHGIDAEDIHFHEVGALDSIADVVGVCEAVRLLGVTSCSASPVALGSGRVRVAHGDMAVPVPAVAELVVGWRTVALAEPGPPSEHHHHHGEDHHHTESHPTHGEPDHHHDEPGRTYDRPAPMLTQGALGELATPTGVALVRTLASVCEPMPAMVPAAIGVGAGGRDVPARPNVVRAVVGESVQTAPSSPTTVIEVMANVDDLDPRLWPAVLDDLLASGALDAWLVPIQMKKGRPGFTVHALVTGETHDTVVSALLHGTSTLGVREVPCVRTVLDRAWRTVEVLGQPLSVKVASQQGRVVHAAAEFESLAEVSRVTGARQSDVATRAAAAIVAAGITPGSEVSW